jgi:iron complex outermembrane receptor protein
MVLAHGQANAQQAQQGASAPAESSSRSSASELETIVVTARRREESLFDVPVSVTPVSGEALSAAGLTSIADIVALVPNANLTTNPRGFDTYISIRGMTQSDSNAAPNFGAYRNGIFNGGHRVNLGPQLDVERVEVLRGPQGGLYGREAVGGAINIVYVMPRPGDALNGYATLDLGNVSRTRVEGAVTLPIGDKVAVRATGWYIDQDEGDYRNITLDRWVDRKDNHGGRLSLAAELAPSLNLETTVEYGEREGPSLLTYAPDGVPNGGFAPANVPPVMSPKETPETVQRDTDSRISMDNLFASAKLTYNTDVGALTLQAAYQDYNEDMVLDVDHTALQPDAGLLVLKQEGFWDNSVQHYFLEGLWESDQTQRFAWRVGLSYFNEEFNLEQIYNGALQTAYLGPLGVPNLGVITGYVGLPLPGAKITTDSISGFADVRYEFTEALSVTGTLRYTKNEESLDWSQGLIQSMTDPLYAWPIVQALFGPQFPSYTLKQSDDYSYTSPSVTFAYMVNPTVNVYALYSTGFRPGGYNTTTTNPADIPYGMETAKNYEFGIKTRWLDDRATVNLAVFRMNQEDLTVQQTDLTSSFNFTYLENVGAARTIGAELEATLRPNQYISASLGVGYLDSEFTRGIVNEGTAYAVDLTGRPLSGVRPWTLSARLDGRAPVSGSIELFGNVGVRWEDGGYIGDKSDIPMDSLTLLNLAAGLDFSKNAQLTLYLHNALDEMVPLYQFLLGDVGTNSGRRYGMMLTYRF